MDQHESEKDVAGNPKPIPIREVVGESEPRPAGRSNVTASAPTSQAPGLRGQRKRPEGPHRRGSSRKKERGQWRRPDRGGTSSGREEPKRSALEPTPLEDFPSRRFEHDGCEWIVRLCGQTSTGSVADPGAPLMHVVFYKAADPLVACGDVFVVGRSLEGLPELRLSELLAEVGSSSSPNESSR